MSSSDSDKAIQKKPAPTHPINPQNKTNAKVKQKKIGHRRVDASTGQTTYKKTASETLSSCIQLGISHTVAKLSAKPERDMLLQDFQTVESISFPANGSNITPAHHHGDFEFCTYAPIAFRYFRDLFGIQPEDYMLSISRHPLVELSNPGASGSLFFVTHDDEFIIKTVQAKEATFLQQLLPGYYMNINQNPRTLLPKFYGLYTVTAGSRHTIRVVVMNNLLPRKIQMHLKFDLKGSTYKRKASKTERQKNLPTYKDLDLISDHPNGLLQVSSDIHEVLTKTLQRDCVVLQSFKIMDYSLLLAIHNIDKCKTQQTTQNSNSTVGGGGTQDPQQPSSTNNLQGARNSKSVMTSTMLRNKYNSDLYHWSGGIPAKNNKGEKLLIFCGIIDILQCYKFRKKMEHSFKSLVAPADTVSVHKPSFYCERFLKFMTDRVFHEDPATAVKQSKRVTIGGSTYRKHATTTISGAGGGGGNTEAGSSKAEHNSTTIRKTSAATSTTSSSSSKPHETSFHKSEAPKAAAANVERKIDIDGDNEYSGSGGSHLKTPSSNMSESNDAAVSAPSPSTSRNDTNNQTADTDTQNKSNKVKGSPPRQGTSFIRKSEKENTKTESTTTLNVSSSVKETTFHATTTTTNSEENQTLTQYKQTTTTTSVEGGQSEVGLEEASALSKEEKSGQQVEGEAVTTKLTHLHQDVTTTTEGATNITQVELILTKDEDHSGAEVKEDRSEVRSDEVTVL